MRCQESDLKGSAVSVPGAKYEKGTNILDNKGIHVNTL